MPVFFIVFMFCHEFHALCPMIVYDGCFPFLVFNSNVRISLYLMSCLVYEYVATCTHFCLLSSGYRLLSFAACHLSSGLRLPSFVSWLSSFVSYRYKKVNIEANMKGSDVVKAFNTAYAWLVLLVQLTSTEPNVWYYDTDFIYTHKHDRSAEDSDRQ